MTMRIIAQIVGFIGMGLFLLSFQFKDNKKLFALQLGSFGVYVVHYLLLGAVTGGVMMFINTLRCVVMYFYNDKKWAKWKGWLWVFFAVYLVNTAYTWDGFLSLLPMVGSVSCLFAYWNRNKRTIRLVNLLLGSPTWLVYDVLTNSIAGAISESFYMLSILISIVRFGWKALDEKG